MNRAKQPIKLGFPYRLYFKQLFSQDIYVRLINPVNFWRRYRIDRLEACHELNTVQHLENCYQIEWRSIHSFGIERNINYTNTSISALLKPVDSNTIIISQPTIQLKYRGVTYCIRNITKTNININCIKIDPSTVQPDCLEQTLDPNNINTSKRSGSN